MLKRTVSSRRFFEYPQHMFWLRNKKIIFSYALLSGGLWISWTICLLLSSADNLCKQFGPRSGPTKCPAGSGPKLFDTLMVFLNNFSKKLIFKKISSRQNSWKITQHAKSWNGKPRFICGRLNIWGFVCETMSCAKSSLHWSVSTIKWLLSDILGVV